LSILPFLIVSVLPLLIVSVAIRVPVVVNSFVVFSVIPVVVPRSVIIPPVVITIVITIGVYFVISSCIGISFQNNRSPIWIVYINPFTLPRVSLDRCYCRTTDSTHNQNKSYSH